ncbi:MAG: sodium:proton antiporter [Myxococcaceae bacterium]
MRKVLVYSTLLLGGLAASQVLPRIGPGAYEPVSHALKLLTMVGLSFIMIHVGREFDLNKRQVRQYGWDYIVAITAAGLPWIFVSCYFVFVIASPESWGSMTLWKEALLQGRFAAPTSAGVLFAMLSAAGLGATWVFRKARVLAIFDDLDTILLMVPLTALFVGLRWQLLAVVAAMVLLLWFAWKNLHRWKIPGSWRWVLTYAVLLALASEGIYWASGWLDPEVPVHFEVLLPAFVLGCVMAHPSHGLEQGEPEWEAREDRRALSIVSGVFMVLVGLSMPQFGGTAAGPAVAQTSLTAQAGGQPGWGTIALHVLAVTLISNLGKMFPTFCYRREASLRERLALSICLFPRGEVGAGVLVVSLSYGISGTATTVALLSLSLNLMLTGLFIFWVKRLIAVSPEGATAAKEHERFDFDRRPGREVKV